MGQQSNNTIIEREYTVLDDGSMESWAGGSEVFFYEVSLNEQAQEEHGEYPEFSEYMIDDDGVEYNKYEVTLDFIKQVMRIARDNHHKPVTNEKEAIEALIQIAGESRAFKKIADGV